MKPRNKYQRGVAEANDALPTYNGQAVMWARENVVTHIAYRLPSGKTTCMDCAHEWMAKSGETVTCPNCGQRLMVLNTKKRRFGEKSYFSVITTFRGLQLQRVFIMSMKSRKGSPADYTTEEVARLWMDDAGQLAVTAKARQLGYYYDSFAMYSSIELRKMDNMYLWMSDCAVYPRYKVIPTLRRNGLVGKFPTEVTPIPFMRSLLQNPHLETIMKSGRMEDLKYFLTNARLNDVWPSYRIAMRNKYDISDIGLWCDYISLLRQLGKDVLNAFYVCPKDLKNAHDKAMERTKEQERQEGRKMIMRKALEAEAEFQKTKGKFFGLCFTDGLITVSVLDSVVAYYEEGAAMHHCVGKLEYYKKPDSLVLSARIGEKRVETVEFSLKTFKVLQSRGVCNQNTQWHERIMSLVNNNREIIASFACKSCH